MRLGVRAALVGGVLLAGDVEVVDGRIAAVGRDGSRGQGVAAPGFVDLQVNGFAGVDFMHTDADGYAHAGEAMLATGTTAYQPTFITAPPEDLTAALRAMPPAGRTGAGGPTLIGAHLEGPFISPARPGVHPVDACRAPDRDLLEALLAAGPVRTMTLAPELPGALALVDVLLERGVVVSLGHTDATAAEANAAFMAGVRTVTHLFNAMRPMVPRDPGVALAALAREDVVVQLIADLHHVAPETVLTAWRAARGRLALVTDAVAAAGSDDGEYVLGGRSVTSADGVVRGPEGQLAGSALTMVEAVRSLHALGVPLAEALSAASTVPARVVGLRDAGELRVGAPADVVVLGDDLEILRVLVAGRERVNT